MSSLEDQAAERKARLAALRNKRKPEPSTSNTTTINTTQSLDQEPPSKKPTPAKPANFELKSRNFNPETRSEIKGSSLPPTTLDENSETVEAVTQRIQDEVLAKFQLIANDLGDVGSLSKEKIRPKNVAWDLQRDIQDELDLLQEKTDDVIRSVVKERIRKLREENDVLEQES